jgi:hypothetical protein
VPSELGFKAGYRLRETLHDSEVWVGCPEPA